ncbi:hypothetical protein L6164_037556 [Bauhinia variegata]|uniref:Uncharacterized protein n=1 Tax=Bauhinia variegata TaxID=167791 RepID=A0ACB9KKJ0_BAUVA|nr:hypothetical protein L6164_037556 [Bauhinia variegata]
MEVVMAKAFKSSSCRELAFMKSTPQAFYDDYWCFNQNNGVSGEDFSVDDLLDFSNGEFQHGHFGVGNGDNYEEDDEEKDSLSVSSQDRGEDDSNSNSSSVSGGGADSQSFFASELAVPVDDLAELEWVSHFVDDSLPELSLLYPVHSEQTKKRTEPEPKPGMTEKPCFPSRVPVKMRSKKSRKANARAWSFSPLLSGSGSSSSSSSCSSGFSSTPALIFAGSVPNLEFSEGLGEPPAKKQKKKSETQTGGSQFQRRCSHCQVQKTPQWRTGPLGAKTLCNACGVRFKSGRLYPEYRPACSPTFSSEVHSNSHRKVLEMRRRKEMMTAGTQSGLTQATMVPSC